MKKMLNFTLSFLLKNYTFLIDKVFDAFQVNHKLTEKKISFTNLKPKLSQLTIVLFLVLGFSITQSYAQRDQITTQAGEKIRCRILDETPSRFIYAYLSPTGKVLRNEIFKNLVTEFKYNFFSSDIVTKGNKLPNGLGDARAENAANNERIDTRKGESSKEAVKNETKNTKGEVKKVDAKKSDEKIVKRGEVESSKESINNTSKANEQESISKKNDAKTTSKTPNTTKAPAKKEIDKATKSEQKVASKTAKKEVMPLSTKSNDNEFNNYLKWRVGGKGGFGNMLAKIPTNDEYSLYQEKLLRGFTFGADAAYFFNDNIGFGFMFNNFKSQNKAENIKYRNEILNTEATGNISNNRSMKFVGPVLYYRKNIDFKTMFILGVSPGAYFYKDKGTYGDTGYTFKGMDFGASATLGVDFLLGNDITGRDIILSLETGYSYGKMRALDLGGGGGAVNLATPIDLSRLDFTIGLRFTRYPRYFR